jgi:hypothetical protein
MSTDTTIKETGENYTAFVKRQFRKSTFGMISVYTVLTIAVVETSTRQFYANTA